MQIKNAIALGTFDGVHKGHRAVLNLPEGFNKIAVTFAVPPKLVLSGESGLITTAEDKCRILKNINIDEIYLLDFENNRNMRASEFLDFLYGKFAPCLISCGFNYRFGKNGEGNTETLQKFCEEKGIEFKCVSPVNTGDIPVSSTLIRKMLTNGEIDKANSLLTEPFSFESEVISGDRRGRTIGFPTVNQKYPKELVRLKFGVYRTDVLIGKKRYSGITNIGIRPTYKSDYIISETYILNFSGNLYGKKIRIVPLEFLREEKKFSSLEELKKQIAEDIKNTDNLHQGD